MLQEFKEFIARGNAIDLAVGLVVGTAFGAVTLGYGLFTNTIIIFLIVGFAVFLVVRAINRLRRTDKAPAPDMAECPHCYTAIPIRATRCPACTSELA